MLVLTGQLRTSQSKKGEARHIRSLTLGEEPELFLGANLLIKFNKGTFFFSSTRLGMLARHPPPPSPRLFHSTLVLGYRCQGFVWQKCLHFPRVFERAVFEGLWTKTLPPLVSHPQLWENWLCPLPTNSFHLNVVLGLRRPWYTKLPSKAVT